MGSKPGIAQGLPAPGAVLLEQILAFAADRPAEALDQLRAGVGSTMEAAGPEAMKRLLTRLGTTGADWAYYAPDPLAVALNATVADLTLTPASRLEGKEHIEAARGSAIVFVANHLSYADANLVQLLLRRAGLGELAGRLTVIAGPKVYSDPMRRFSSLCFGTIKTPQSAALSSEEAVLGARDVARVARETIALASERQAAGDALLVFAEGTRSRTGGMQRALPAVSRYFEAEGALLIPLGIEGSERFVPVGEERLHATDVTIRAGRGARARELLGAAGGSRRLAMDAVGTAVAHLLPPAYQGAYAASATNLEAARQIAHALFGGGGGEADDQSQSQR